MAKPAVFINCKICKKIFKRKRVKQFFCSFTCGAKGKKYVQCRFSKKIKVICDFCEKEFEKWPCLVKKTINEKHYCNPVCRKLAMSANKTLYGFKKTTGSPLNPYKRCMKEGKFVYEHRWIMEQKIGRKLKRNEHVHHINGNPKDNRIENLEILSNADHAKIHSKKL
jgi:hypothetical protein